jgi:hypothetical protein
MDFIRVGRSGRMFYVYGAPEEWYGPHSSAGDAEKAYTYIVDHFEDFEVVDRKVYKRGK